MESEGKFDLSKMKEGDSFIGCKCGHKVPSGELPPDNCPECGKKMFIYKLTKIDLEESKWK